MTDTTGRRIGQYTTERSRYELREGGEYGWDTGEYRPGAAYISPIQREHGQIGWFIDDRGGLSELWCQDGEFLVDNGPGHSLVRLTTDGRNSWELTHAGVRCDRCHRMCLAEFTTADSEDLCRRCTAEYIEAEYQAEKREQLAASTPEVRPKDRGGDR